MGQPRDAISLSTSCTMLNKIVLTTMVLSYIIQCLMNYIQLMKTRENQSLCNFCLSRQFIGLFLNFYEYELTYKLNQSVFFQYVFPHIRHTVSIIKYRIPFTSINTNPFTQVKWKEIGGIAIQLGCHIDLV